MRIIESKPTSTNPNEEVLLWVSQAKTQVRNMESVKTVSKKGVWFTKVELHICLSSNVHSTGIHLRCCKTGGDVAFFWEGNFVHIISKKIVELSN
jgi:hypothetical protein